MRLSSISMGTFWGEIVKFVDCKGLIKYLAHVTNHATHIHQLGHIMRRNKIKGLMDVWGEQRTY